MTEAQWLERCAARFITIAKMHPSEAVEYARTCYETDDPREGLTPEEAADNEMECWGD